MNIAEAQKAFDAAKAWHADCYSRSAKTWNLLATRQEVGRAYDAMAAARRVLIDAELRK